MPTRNEIVRWMVDLGNYAEDVKHLDPIGSSDIIADFTHHAVMQLEKGQELPDPSIAWQEFTLSESFKKYKLKPF